jgi:hypothetical protein
LSPQDRDQLARARASLTHLEGTVDVIMDREERNTGRNPLPAPPAAPNSTDFTPVVPIVLILAAIMYFLIFRPHQKRRSANPTAGLPSVVPSANENSATEPNGGWFYAVAGEKIGPIINRSKLIELLTSGTIGRDTMVWRQGMDDWKPASQTDMWAYVSAARSPPPLPPTEVDNTLAWLIAFVPLIGEVLERITTDEADTISTSE